MLTTQQIVNRRTTYACCAMDYLHKFVQADIYGDTKCAKDSWDKAVLMYWAQEQMCNTPVLDGEEGCNTVEFATQVASKADCFCKQCGCEPVSPTVPPVPTDCTITPNYTVINAVDVDQRLIIEADSPTVGDSYYVVTDSGGSGWTVNTVVTWNGGGWDAVTVQPGEVILATTPNTYWTPGTNNEPGLLFPTIIGYLVAFNNQYVIQSTYPWVSSLLGRNVLVRGYVNGTWQIIYSGPESALAEPTTYDFQTLPITALQVVYLVADCQYTAGATVIPPFGECGTITATITAERDCGTNEFFVIVDIEQVDGYPLGNIIATLNGTPQAPVAASLGVTLLGPYQTGDVVGVRITNAQDSECDFDAGNYQDPNIPIADRTVVSAVDASFQGSASTGSPYLIVSDTTGSGNTWAQHVGEFYNGAIFFALVEGEVVQTQTETGFDKFWQRVNGVTVQMYPSVTLTNTQAFPNPWTVVSDSTFSAATRFRPTVVEGLFGTTWYPIWAGVESQLEDPQTVDFTSYGLGAPSEVRVTYFGTQCPIIVAGDIVNSSVDEELVCDAIDYYVYAYSNNDTNTWLFTSPSGSVDVLFAAGTMGPGTVIRAYDGTNNLGTPILSLTGNFPFLAGALGTAVSGSMFIEIESAPTGAEAQTPWVFGAMCTPSGIRPNAQATPIDDCTNYQFSIDIEVFDVGNSNDGLIDIQYRILGVPGTTTLTGIGLGVTTIGPFDYNQEVEILLINTADPLANVLMGTFTNAATCETPANPCLPEGLFKVDYQGDLSELPDPPENPGISNTFYILSDNTDIGTWPPGDIVVWNVPNQEWEYLLTVPEGAFIYGGDQTVIGNVGEVTVFGNGPSGPYNAFAPILVSPNPYAVSAADAWRIRIAEVGDGFVTTNRPVALQVLSEGEWIEVWTGTEQQLGVVNLIEIPVPFTLTRAIYNYDTCAVEVAYVIDPQQGIEQP
jgi:hypothetical protein